MARPVALQFLRKGVLLVGAVFPRFVETWNWLVGAFDSMCGDGDLNPQQGAIFLDRTNPDKPIIRLDKTKIAAADSVTTDDLSVGENTSGSLEIAGYEDTTNTESDSLAKILAGDYDGDSEIVERGISQVGLTSRSVKYRKHGHFVAGYFTNITFTPDSDGNVAINVFYK